MTAAAAEQEPPTVRAASVFLHPGQLFVSADPAVVTTVLGSCVAVCLWDPATRVGGVNHYLLPHGAGDGTASPRFGSLAMPMLLERVLAQGGLRSRLEAKVFGGACVTGGAPSPGRHLGDENVERAVSFLRDVRIPVAARATGGARGRKVIFHTADGSAWVKEL